MDLCLIVERLSHLAELDRLVAFAQHLSLGLLQASLPGSSGGLPSVDLREGGLLIR